jgi:molecular chaperone DnaK (HSP70)
VDEATAAAVGYAARMDPGDAFGVLDFGAGTLNVVVVRVVAAGRAGAGAGVRVVAKSGIDLGGADIDLLLARHAADQLGLPRTGASTRDRRFRRLLTSAEEAKITLTTSETAVVSAGRSGDVEITRRTFEDLLREHRMLGRAGQALRRTLDQAAASGYPSSSLMGLFLVGGTCLIPAVQRLVLDQFDPDLVRLDRPLEAVAAGAARLAGGHELHDHIQHDYAIRHRNPATGRYDFEPLATAGTAFPTKEPVHSLTIQAARRGQTKFGVAIYELAHATAGTRDAAPSGGLELVFDAEGNASAVPVTPRRHAERSQRWLNETAPTTLRADPPAEPGTDRFRLEFRIDERRRLTLSAFDMECGRWILDHHPVVELS